MALAQSWALRCQLELQQHTSAVFTTLTYSDEYVPVTLPKPSDALPYWLKRLRKATGKKIRFFAAAEYGERTKRPHFHAILYGLDHQEHAEAIQQAWTHPRTKQPYGHTRSDPINSARIAYTAGYCQDKIGYKRYPHERVDESTGEVYQWQPPYKLMSRRPGIGAEARRFIQSWRMYAIKDGHKMPVPRYLHEAWKQQATKQEIEDLAYEKYKLTLTRDTVNLDAAEKIANKRQELTAQKRAYDK